MKKTPENDFGFVVVTHQELGSTALQIIQTILQENPRMIPVAIHSDAPEADNKRIINEAIQHFNTKSGVIILTDLFGATPSTV